MFASFGIQYAEALQFLYNSRYVLSGYCSAHVFTAMINPVVRARSRSRSRDPDRRQERHVLHCVPQQVDLSLFGLYHYCTFSGTGIPRLALFHSLRILWTQGIRIQYRGGYHYENDSKCTKMHTAMNRRNPLVSHHRPDVSAFVRDVSGLSTLERTKILTTIAAPGYKNIARNFEWDQWSNRGGATCLSFLLILDSAWRTHKSRQNNLSTKYDCDFRDGTSSFEGLGGAI